MFELSKKELAEWRSQFGTSNSEIMGLRVSPFAFTEHGVIMLASVLNSEKGYKSQFTDSKNIHSNARNNDFE